MACGMPHALQGLKAPALLVVGDQDQTAPYAGVRFIFENAVASDRYLLVFQSGDHEVAVNPAPPITFTRWREYVHYQEPALDNTRTNNVCQHFLTAFLGMHLKGDDYRDYLDVKYATPTSATTTASRAIPPVSGRASRSGPPLAWRCTTAAVAAGLR